MRFTWKYVKFSRFSLKSYPFKPNQNRPCPQRFPAETLNIPEALFLLCSLQFQFVLWDKDKVDGFIQDVGGKWSESRLRVVMYACQTTSQLHFLAWQWMFQSQQHDWEILLFEWPFVIKYRIRNDLLRHQRDLTYRYIHSKSRGSCTPFLLEIFSIYYPSLVIY